MAPQKVANAPRGTVIGNSSQGVITFTVRAVPLPTAILEFLLDNILTLRKVVQRRGDFADVPENDPDEGLVEESDSSEIQGDVVKKPSVKPDRFWSALADRCREAGGEWENVVERIWSFGPQNAGGCVLIDARKVPLQSQVLLSELLYFSEALS